VGTITRFEEIEAWQTARELTRLVYTLSNQGAFARDFGLRDQMRRAAVSIMSNIAEGFESRTQALFIDFLGRAKGSAGELRAQAYVALDAGYINQPQFKRLFDQAEKCSRQISRFMSYLQTHPDRRQVREDRGEYDVSTFERAIV
jgi:four helix bundle protein